MEDTKRFYDLTAEQTADEWYENDILMPTILDFLSLLPERPKVLDLGCGPGYESMRLASVGAEVIGVDFSPECIRIAKERCPQCQFELVDFRHLDRSFGEFDGVFAAASFIHIRPEELGVVLSRVADVLKVEGYLLAIIQDGEGIRESKPVINGHELRRVVYLYSKDSFISAASRFSYVREGYLAANLTDEGWRGYIFRVKPSKAYEAEARVLS